MADLKALIRFRTYEVDEKKKALAVLFERLEELEKMKADHLQQIEDEAKFLEEAEEITIDQQAAFNSFRDATKGKIAKIDQHINDLETKIEIAQDELRDSFAELKKVEITQRNREKEEEKAELKKETDIMDEIGLTRHYRLED